MEMCLLYFTFYFKLLVIGDIFIMLLNYAILLAFYFFKPHALGTFLSTTRQKTTQIIAIIDLSYMVCLFQV